MKGATISAAMEDPKRLEEGLGHSTALVPNIDDKSIHLSEKVGKTDGGDDTHNEKEERSAARDHLLAEHGGDRQPVVQQKSKRVVTLDAFRGLTTAVYWIQEHVFNDVWHSERAGTLLYVISAEITFWAVDSGVLHKLGIYWKL
ncbi:hypothetical protein OIU76_009776 [Salix suchowensis]|nr:hypothetical protein OIU76_009776 [Salix suchowensis]